MTADEIAVFLAVIAAALAGGLFALFGPGARHADDNLADDPSDDLMDLADAVQDEFTDEDRGWLAVWGVKA